MNGASPPTSQKDALLSSQPNKTSPPSSPSSRGKVSESVREELSPPPQKAAPKEQSKPEPLKKKKDPVGENCHARPSSSPSV
ncbi:Myomesin-1 [Cricetulus griseus]|uniref:Myomesin-1 n=2 Tax=Cricetulus griseus TaxID=10029 RepID=G3I8U8_CRIGR|nr:Myomesin-1 [Cricetulus griseus]